MKAFNEKCDAVLHYLKMHDKLSWRKFTEDTHIPKDDAILAYLKDRKEFIDYNASAISITPKGKMFIKTTSFVEQRKAPYS